MPTSATAKTEINSASVQTVSVDRNDALKLNEQPLGEAELAERLAELKKSQPGLAVVVRPHKELPVQDFVRVMDLLHKAGITKVGVMTRPEDQGGGAPSR